MSESQANAAAPANPFQILEMNMSYAAARILMTSVQLGVFSHIAAGHRDAESITTAAGANLRAMRILLNALVGYQLLTREGDQYSLTPTSREFLVRENPNYFGHMMETDYLWNGWSQLTEIVRSGKPATHVNRQSGADEFFPRLVRSLHVMNGDQGKRLAGIIGAGTTRHGLKVLDVACGSGVWGIAMAEADKQAHVTYQDFPLVLAQTRDYVKRHNVDSRADYLEGNLSDVEYGKDKFDVALLGHILHSEGERSSRNLLKKLHAAMRPQGCVAIMEFIVNDDRTGPPVATQFAVNMLVHTDEGDTFSLTEMTQWLKDAGFARVETADIGSHSPVILGYK